jgi:hypothetical protein
MLTKLTFAALASLLLAGQVMAQSSMTAPHKLNAILCTTEAQAIAFATGLAAGQTEPMAIDRVNKASGGEVCGRYIGFAVVEVEKTANYQGSLYMLAGLRFTEDGKLGWTASWVTPFSGARLERGA